MVAHQDWLHVLFPFTIQQISTQLYAGHDICHADHTKRNFLSRPDINDMMIAMHTLDCLTDHLIIAIPFFCCGRCIFCRLTGHDPGPPVHCFLAQTTHSLLNKALMQQVILIFIRQVHFFCLCPKFIDPGSIYHFRLDKESIITTNTILIGTIQATRQIRRNRRRGNHHAAPQHAC